MFRKLVPRQVDDALQHHRHDCECCRVVFSEISNRRSRVEAPAYDERRTEQATDDQVRKPPGVEHRRGEDGRLPRPQRNCRQQRRQ